MTKEEFKSFWVVAKVGLLNVGMCKATTTTKVDVCVVESELVVQFFCELRKVRDDYIPFR